MRILITCAIIIVASYNVKAQDSSNTNTFWVNSVLNDLGESDYQIKTFYKNQWGVSGNWFYLSACNPIIKKEKTGNSSSVLNQKAGSNGSYFTKDFPTLSSILFFYKNNSFTNDL